MKNLLLLSILTAFIIQYGNTQDRGYIAISSGASFPTGDFGSNDINNEAAGFATTGPIFDLAFAQRFSKNIGMTLLARGQVNGFDTAPLVDELYAMIPYVPWTADDHNWGTGVYMGGVYGTFPLGSHKINLEGRAMIGYVHATSPSISISGVSNGHYYESSILSATAGTFGYLFGIGFKFGIGKHLGFLLNADYLGAKPEFEDVESYTRFDTIFTTMTNSFEQTFGTVNVGAGIGWRW